MDEGEAADKFVGVVTEIGALPTGAFVTLDGLSKMLHRHPASIRRAVERGELPRPTRLLGEPTWTAGVIVRHIETRLEGAAKEGERFKRKVASLNV